MSALRDWVLKPSEMTPLGKNLSRPECVVVERDGTLWISDDRAAVTRLDPDGTQTLVGNLGGAPNGLAMDREGRLLVANIEDGKVHRLFRDGRSEVVLDELNGEPLGAVNFVYLDGGGRLWITVSTRTVPRSEAISVPRPDGYVIRMDEDGPRVILDDLLFTNEIRFDAEEKYLYVAETTAGRVVRFPVGRDGTMGAREVFGPQSLGAGALVDGITFDVEGNLWVTEISRHQLIVLSPEGEARVIFEDPEGSLLHFPTSIAFGGSDLRTVYVGSLRMGHLVSFRSPVAGFPMYHWG